MTDAPPEHVPPTLDSVLLERMLQEAEWRGQVNARLEQHEKEISKSQTSIIGRIDRLDADFNKRMDTQDERMEGIHEQTKATNGRVNDLEKRNEKEDGAEDERLRAHEDAVAWHKFRVNAKVAVLAACIGGAMGETISLIAHAIS